MPAIQLSAFEFLQSSRESNLFLLVSANELESDTPILDEGSLDETCAIISRRILERSSCEVGSFEAYSLI